MPVAVHSYTLPGSSTRLAFPTQALKLTAAEDREHPVLTQVRRRLVAMRTIRPRRECAQF